jgi:pullulanase
MLDVTAVQDQAARQASFENFKELLAIRKSSPLFRLHTKAQIDQRVKLHNTGPFQIPGIVAMSIEGCAEPDFTPPEGALMVIFNATDDPRTLGLFGTEAWTLHPVQQGSADPVVKTAKHDANGFYVPARTTAVFQRASQTSCAPYPRDLFVRGGFNDWGNPTPTDQYKLVFQGGTAYSVSAPVSPAGTYGFKIADAGWTEDTNCGGAADGVAVRLGIPVTLACNNDSKNLTLAASTAGDYTFALDATSTVNPVLTVSKTPPTPLTLYVRGGFTDWGTSLPLVWDGTSTYRATGTAGAASVGVQYEFKIADADWGSTNNHATDCGAAVGASDAQRTVAIGTAFGLTCAESTPNMRLTFPATGDYLFAVDWSNPASPQLTVEKLPVDAAVFVRGSFNGWADPPPAAYQMGYLGGGIYSLNAALAATAHDFKIASADWVTVNCGAGPAGDTVTVGTTLDIACGDGTGNLKLTPATAGTYTFTYKRNDAASGEVTVTGP